MLKELKKSKGQGLLELVVAIGIITVGLFSVWNLFLSNFSGEKEAQARVIGSNLAREGVEAVKNIRDTNWLRIDQNDNISWDEGLVGDGTAVLSGLFAGGDVALDFSPADVNNPATILYLNNSGFYDQAPTSRPSPYRRLITLRNICCTDANADFQCDNLSSPLETKAPGASCDVNQLKIGLDVESYVVWPINGQNRSMTAEDQLFNWR